MSISTYSVPLGFKIDDLQSICLEVTPSVLAWAFAPTSDALDLQDYEFQTTTGNQIRAHRDAVG